VAPTVSVIIPAYNQARFLGYTVESVLAQTFTDYEIIVVDDGSTDATLAVLSAYTPYLQVLSQKNAGLSAARNAGLAIARGDMIAFLDADDLWYPEMLALTVAYLQTHPECDLVVGGWDYIDEVGNPLSGEVTLAPLEARIEKDFFKTLILRNQFIIHAILLRRKSLDACGNFDTTLHALEDWDLWLRLAEHGCHVGFIHQRLVRYRRHRHCMSRDVARMEQAFHQVLTKVFTRERLIPELQKLQPHAHISQWLSLAEYSQEAGLQSAVRRQYLQNAIGMYQQATFDEELSRDYIFRGLRIPEASEFVRVVRASLPETLAPYEWAEVYRLFKENNYLLALKVLLKFLYNHPYWFFKKGSYNLIKTCRRNLRIYKQ
jgi:glycosyltransferase involved in cell wall biosynthesis